VLSDESWALATRRHAEGARDFGILVGAGVAVWVAWVFGTLLGVQVGALPVELERLGLDMLMAAFFVAILASSWRGTTDFVPWLCAAIAALAGAIVLPAGYPILIGALACGLAATAGEHGRAKGNRRD